LIFLYQPGKTKSNSTLPATKKIHLRKLLAGSAFHSSCCSMVTRLQGTSIQHYLAEPHRLSRHWAEASILSKGKVAAEWDSRRRCTAWPKRRGVIKF